MSQQPNHFYEFGPFRLDVAERLLLRDGAVVPLTPKAFDLLLALVEQHGHLLEKDELIKQVWPDTFVEEGNLTWNVSYLRKALGEGKNGQHYIETMPKRGYRFVAEVRQSHDTGDTSMEELRGITDVARGEDRQEARSASSGTGEPTVAPSFPQRWRSNRKVRGIAGLLAVLAVVGSYLWTSRWEHGTASGTAVRSIAVLPFKPLNHTSDDEYLGIGIADAIITRLSGTGKVIVRPTSAITRYSTPAQDPLTAGREQRVDAVLDASLWRLGERVRVTVRLLTVRDGAPLWSYECEETCTDVFAVQTMISERVAEALKLQLTGTQRARLTRRDTESREANQLYLLGRYYWHKQTGEWFRKAVATFEQAIEKDQHYAAAYVGIADSYAMMATHRILPTKEACAKVRAAATKALEIDDTLVEAHTALAHVRMLEWDWPGAEREFKRAIDLNPNYAIARNWYGIYLSLTGQHDQAITEMKQALTLDPFSLLANSDFGWVLFRARRYDQTIEQCRKTLELEPSRVGLYRLRGLAYEQQGMFEDFLASWQKTVFADASPESIAAMREAFATAGWRGFWRQRLDQVKEQSRQKPVSPYDLAEIHARLGEKDEAFAWLEKALADRDWGLILLKTDPRMDSLRSDPRFIDLLRRVGLAP